MERLWEYPLGRTHDDARQAAEFIAAAAAELRRDIAAGTGSAPASADTRIEVEAGAPTGRHRARHTVRESGSLATVVEYLREQSGPQARVFALWASVGHEPVAGRLVDPD